MPNEISELPDAADALGKGINILSFKYDDIHPMAQILDTSSGVSRYVSGQTESSSQEGSTFSELIENVALSIGLEGSYGGFSGSISTTLSNETRSSVSTEFIRHSNVVSGTYYRFSNSDAASLKLKTTSAFKSDAKTMSASAFLDKYGTHVLVDISVGGRYESYFYAESSESYTKQDFQLAAKAKYEGAGGSVEGSVDYQRSKEATNKVSNLKRSTRVAGGTNATRAALENTPSTDALVAWSETLASNPALLGLTSEGTAPVPVWDLVDDNREAILTEFKRRAARQLPIVVVASDWSAWSNSPRQSVSIPDNHKLLGGGVASKAPGGKGGPLLTGSYPGSDNRSWVGEGKAHIYDCSTPYRVFAIALSDPLDLWETAIQSATLPFSGFPMYAGVKPDFTLVGGGAKVTWNGQGLLLTMSQPDIEDGRTSQSGVAKWVARAKPHKYPDSGDLTVWTIGLRSRIGLALQQTVTADRSIRTGEMTTGVPTGMKMTCGGASVTWNGYGLMLVQSYPKSAAEWFAHSRPVEKSDSGTTTVTTVGIKAV